MWVIFQSWDGYESTIYTFKTKEGAEKYFEELQDYTSAQVYLAKVDKTFNVKKEER